MDKPATDGGLGGEDHAMPLRRTLTRRRPDLSATKMMVRLPRARHICRQAEKMPEYPSVPSKMVASSNYSLLLTSHREDSGRMVDDGEKDEDEDELQSQGKRQVTRPEAWNMPKFTQDASASRNFSAFC